MKTRMIHKEEAIAATSRNHPSVDVIALGLAIFIDGILLATSAVILLITMYITDSFVMAAMAMSIVIISTVRDMWRLFSFANVRDDLLGTAGTLGAAKPSTQSDSGGELGRSLR